MTMREDEISAMGNPFAWLRGAGALRYGTVFIIVPVWRKKGALAAALHACNMGEGATGCVFAAVGHAMLRKDREPFVGHAAPWYHSRVCCLGRKPRRLMR